jgi:hypothetical protein
MSGKGVCKVVFRLSEALVSSSSSACQQEVRSEGAASAASIKLWVPTVHNESQVNEQQQSVGKPCTGHVCCLSYAVLWLVCSLPGWHWIGSQKRIMRAHHKRVQERVCRHAA